jgi:hypothetical protein
MPSTTKSRLNEVKPAVTASLRVTFQHSARVVTSLARWALRMVEVVIIRIQK